MLRDPKVTPHAVTEQTPLLIGSNPTLPQSFDAAYWKFRLEQMQSASFFQARRNIHGFSYTLMAAGILFAALSVALHFLLVASPEVVLGTVYGSAGGAGITAIPGALIRAFKREFWHDPVWLVEKAQTAVTEIEAESLAFPTIHSRYARLISTGALTNQDMALIIQKEIETPIPFQVFWDKHTSVIFSFFKDHHRTLLITKLQTEINQNQMGFTSALTHYAPALAGLLIPESELFSWRAAHSAAQVIDDRLHYDEFIQMHGAPALQYLNPTHMPVFRVRLLGHFAQSELGWLALASKTSTERRLLAVSDREALLIVVNKQSEKIRAGAYDYESFVASNGSDILRELDLAIRDALRNSFIIHLCKQTIGVNAIVAKYAIELSLFNETEPYWLPTVVNQQASTASFSHFAGNNPAETMQYLTPANTAHLRSLFLEMPFAMMSHTQYAPHKAMLKIDNSDIQAALIGETIKLDCFEFVKLHELEALQLVIVDPAIRARYEATLNQRVANLHNNFSTLHNMYRIAAVFGHSKAQVLTTRWYPHTLSDIFAKEGAQFCECYSQNLLDPEFWQSRFAYEFAPLHTSQIFKQFAPLFTLSLLSQNVYQQVAGKLHAELSLINSIDELFSYYPYDIFAWNLLDINNPDYLRLIIDYALQIQLTKPVLFAGSARWTELTQRNLVPAFLLESIASLSIAIHNQRLLCEKDLKIIDVRHESALHVIKDMHDRDMTHAKGEAERAHAALVVAKQKVAQHNNAPFVEPESRGPLMNCDKEQAAYDRAQQHFAVCAAACGQFQFALGDDAAAQA